MMKASNGWSTVFLLVALIVTGEGLQFIEFTQRHPEVISNILVLALIQGIGQLFLYSMASYLFKLF